MREIKFRAWDKDKKLMKEVHGLCWDNEYEHKLEVEYVYEGEGNDWDYEDECILMQYTGLKDKNGKEIYEGDIVKHISLLMNWVVKWLNSSWMLENSDKLTENIDFVDEVIGDIYENPELIK